MLREITENTELKLQTRTAWNQTGETGRNGIQHGLHFASTAASC